MKVSNALLALGLMAAISSVAHLSFAQTAALKPATPIAASAPTAVPALIPYSGAVIAGDGRTFAAEAGVTFQIYKDEVGGEALWTETQTVAIDSTGHYKVQLGAANPNGLPTDLFASGEARWLEVQVAGEATQPRVLLVSVPYALKAADATTLGGLPASAFALARPASEPAAAVSPAITPNVTSNVTTTGGNSGLCARIFRNLLRRRFADLCEHHWGSRYRDRYPQCHAGRQCAGVQTLDAERNRLYFCSRPTCTATASTGFQFPGIQALASAYDSSSSDGSRPPFPVGSEAHRQRYGRPEAH